jgi:membrane protein implicated in regulation of membrane protease activity
MVIQAPYRWRVVITRVIIALALFMLGGLLYLLVSVAHGNMALAAVLGLSVIILVFAFLGATVYFIMHRRRRRRRHV